MNARHETRIVVVGGMKKLWNRIVCYLEERVASFLDAEESGATYIVANSMEALARTLHKGDVILVEGRTRFSRGVRLFTQSQWTHAALYIGDEIWERYPDRRADLRQLYGDYADKLLVEALVKDGVVTVPLNKYEDHELRICRPIGVELRALQRVLNTAINDLGKQYDNRNIIDLALQLLPINFGPFRKKGAQVCIGACTDLAVMCSGVIAKAFQSVGFLIRPTRELLPLGSVAEDEVPQLLPVMKHFSHITPRDFDLSCNFAIIKVPAYREPAVPAATGQSRAAGTAVIRKSTTGLSNSTAA